MRSTRKQVWIEEIVPEFRSLLLDDGGIGKEPKKQQSIRQVEPRVYRPEIQKKKLFEGEENDHPHQMQRKELRVEEYESQHCPLRKPAL